MRRFVLDCSVTMSWCFESEGDDYARAVLGALAEGGAVVPPLWPLEVANVLLVAERRRRVTRADAARFLGLLAELPLAIAPPVAVEDMGALIGLGREHALSAYDAAYLHLALREHLPLATRDRGLRAAARSAGVAPFVAR
jgi:predicted nucleic acid-binding protein